VETVATSGEGARELWEAIGRHRAWAERSGVRRRRQADRLGAARPRRLRLAYRLGVNDYAGVRSAQLLVEYLETVADPE